MSEKLSFWQLTKLVIIKIDMICMKFCWLVEFIFRSVSKSPKLRFIENKDDQMTLVRIDLRNTNQQLFPDNTCML